MKKIALSIVALLTLSFSLMAQPKMDKKGDKPQSHKRGFDKMKGFKGIDLSDAQKAQLKEQNDAIKKQMDALNANDKITMGEYRKQKAALDAKRKQNFENILTAEQKAKMAESKVQMQKKHEQKAEAHINKLKEKLSLTDAQVAQLKANNDAIAAKSKAIRENKTLSEEQKKQQMKAVMADRKASLEKVLTAEQLEKMKSFKGGDRKNKEGKK